MIRTSPLHTIWYESHPIRWALYPFSLCFQGIYSVRAWFLKKFCQEQFPIPIIVVGNITVGGAGKTPLVIALALKMKEKGFRVGIVSRGYKAKNKYFPYEVKESDSPAFVGDEPFLILQKTNCPVVIAPKRVEAVHYLLEKHNCDLVISDDGLQHYKMGRAIEIAVLDERGVGNSFCLPAGPLREKVSRLKTVDFLILNGGEQQDAYAMYLRPTRLVHLKSGATISFDQLPEPIAAVAGIGNPKRFFNSLKEKGLSFRPYVFKDHYPFQEKDFTMQEKSIVMTEKDAVKCKVFAKENMYYLPIEAQLDDKFWKALCYHEQLQKHGHLL